MLFGSFSEIMASLMSLERLLDVGREPFVVGVLVSMVLLSGSGIIGLGFCRLCWSLLSVGNPWAKGGSVSASMVPSSRNTEAESLMSPSNATTVVSDVGTKNGAPCWFGSTPIAAGICGGAAADLRFRLFPVLFLCCCCCCWGILPEPARRQK